VAAVNSDGAFTAVSFNGMTQAQSTDLTDNGFSSIHTHVIISATEPATMTPTMLWVDTA
jgi:hypothetical protein